MTAVMKPHRASAFFVLAAGAMLIPALASAQSLAEFNRKLAALKPQVSAALGNQGEASSVVNRLDEAEAEFAKIASAGKANRRELAAAYSELEGMLSRLYTAYRKKKDDCITAIDNGGQCDYDTPEQIELRALYPLSWLRFEGAAALFAADAQQARRLLNAAIDGFTQSMLLIADPDLIRENLLGRAYCERELGKYSAAEYDKALQDFKQIMSDGPATRQYRAAEQGLATTYAAMGQMDKAAELTRKLAAGATGGQKAGMEMLRLQSLFKAEAAAHDPARRAGYHKEAVDFMKSKEGDKAGWSVVVASVAQMLPNPVMEFGNSSDPFEKHLLAEVLYAKKDVNGAAKYFLEAARTGKYPRDYKYAIDLQYRQKRPDLVERLIDELARQPGNPDAEWAGYMRFKLAYSQWEQTGMKNEALEGRWASAGGDYLKRYARGKFSDEVRFRIAERLQRERNYAEAARMYSEVGAGDYRFAARFNQAQCDYFALVAASRKDQGKAREAKSGELRTQVISLLDETVKAAPEAEHAASAPAQKKFIHDITGRAIYILAGLLREERNRGNAQKLAVLLKDYESQYPEMSPKFNDVFEWRIRALRMLGRYDDIEGGLNAFLERNRGSAQNSDLIKEVGLGFWKDAQMKQAGGDQVGFKQDAKLTAAAYRFFEDEVKAGRMQVKSLTGTLSILGQALLALGDDTGAEAVFSQVVKADPASPDANAGLARIAQSKKNYRDAVNLWTSVENNAAESDNLWYDAKYNIAEIYAAQGNVPGACAKLAQTRAEHPSLGTPEMKARWDGLQRKLCLNRGGA